MGRKDPIEEIKIPRGKRPCASRETLDELNRQKKNIIVKKAFFPVVRREEHKKWLDRKLLDYTLLSDIQKKAFQNNLGQMMLPDISQYSHAIIKDRLTGEKMGDLYYDTSPEDWVAFYYHSEVRLVKKGKQETAEWHGCMAVNVSPVDGKLGFESASGQDSRDFRGNFAVPQKLQLDNIKAREFNKPHSKFTINYLQ